MKSSKGETGYGEPVKPNIYRYRSKRTGETLYRIRYHDGGRHHRQESGFRRIIDAERALAQARIDVANGSYAPRSGADTPIGAYGAQALADWAATCKQDTEKTLTQWHKHVEPMWGGWRLGSVKHSDVQSWVNALADGTADTADGQPESLSTIKKCVGMLRKVYEAANRDGLYKGDPTQGVRYPARRQAPEERHYLTAKQLLALADAAGGDNHGDVRRALVLTLGLCGLRIGEARALTVADVDMGANVIHVTKSRSAGSHYEETTPKTQRSRRNVAMLRIVADALGPLVEGRAPGDFVFTNTKGGMLGDVKPGNGRGGSNWYYRAKAAAGVPLGLTVHDLRHTAASIAISSGANVKAVQNMLGHESAMVTLDTYADLFPDDSQAVAASMDAVVDAAQRHGGRA